MRLIKKRMIKKRIIIEILFLKYSKNFSTLNSFTSPFKLK